MGLPSQVQLSYRIMLKPLLIQGHDSDTAWTPEHRFNLTGNREIPFTAYAKFVVDTGTSLGQGGYKEFFKSQAQTHIAHALELLHELRRPITLAGAFELLSGSDQLEQEIQSLRELHPFPRRIALGEQFSNRFLTQPEQQLGGIRETLG